MNTWWTPVLLFAIVLLALGAIQVIALVIAAPVIGQAIADGMRPKPGRRQPPPADLTPAARTVGRAQPQWDDADTQTTLPRVRDDQDPPAGRHTPAPASGAITASHRRLR